MSTNIFIGLYSYVDEKKIIIINIKQKQCKIIFVHYQMRAQKKTERKLFGNIIKMFKRLRCMSIVNSTWNCAQKQEKRVKVCHKL